LVVFGAVAQLSAEDAPKEAAATEKKAAKKIDGNELFLREWVADDSRSHGGDGIGPVFNYTSCVSCHMQGGVGGAGPNGKNVDIITAFKSSPTDVDESNDLFSVLARVLVGKGAKKGDKETAETKEERRLRKIRLERKKLAKVHPGFLTAGSVVLHRSSTKDGYLSWRRGLSGAGRFGAFEVSDPIGISVRDSAPYLHDGRAGTIEQAIAFHAGEATRTRAAFFSLEKEARRDVLVFLKSLAAPE